MPFLHDIIPCYVAVFRIHKAFISNCKISINSCIHAFVTVKHKFKYPCY